MAECVNLRSVRDRALEIIANLRRATAGFPEPASEQIIREYGRDPFFILVSCLLSLRAKDTVTVPVSRILFARIRTPQELAAMPRADLEKIIHSIGFYRTKAQTLQEVSTALIDRFGGVVPRTEAELLSIKGIGRKTANLVLAQAFGMPAICVDVHVHRIANRLGLVKTDTPEKTELALKELLPQQHWAEINRLLVMWGQQVCLPVAPRCSQCALEPLCPRFGVKKSR